MPDPNDSLSIDFVDAGSGRIGLCICPGRFEAGLDPRSLSDDFHAIAATGATHLLTLIEDHEFDLLKVDPIQFAALCKNHEMTWHRLPIRDMATPDTNFEAEWITTGKQIRAALRHGETVVMHCRGGRGRAGTIAARVLIEFGEQPPVAKARVRGARSGAIETCHQESFLSTCHTITDAD